MESWQREISIGNMDEVEMNVTDLELLDGRWRNNIDMISRFEDFAMVAGR